MYTTIMNKSCRSAVSFLKKCGCTPIKGHYHQNYHYSSGFFYSPSGKLWYWCTSDDRSVGVNDGTKPFWFMDTPLIRTAKDLKDFTGGHNNYPKTDEELVMLVSGS